MATSNTTDKSYYNLQQSVTKALMGTEMPLKVKHARAAIIGTYHYQGSATFWAVALRQPILENRISAWKFCHLLHKVLREGHNLCCQESQRNIKILNDLGKLWSHLTDGYGICILQYTKLLILKIEFHIRNPRFPGTLKMSRTEIEQIGAGDINFIFQLTIEIFDYLDALIGLQATVFNSLKTYNVNSMTLPGQCRVAALIPCIEDANPLYDFAIRFMFKLHVHLPHDMLDGHRQRFNAVFRQLRTFYKQSDDLQYFVNLVSVPKLPSQLPNFSRNSEINEYQPPTVVIPEEPVTEPVIEEVIIKENKMENVMLIDATYEQEEPKPKQTDYFEQLIRERDDLIQHLQNDSSTMRTTFEYNQQQYEQNFKKLNDELIVLKTEIHSRDNTMQTIQQEKQILEEKIRNYDSEKTVVEEKFAKLLPLYKKTRDDHINLLRQDQETNKAMLEVKKSFEQLQNNKACVENELTELKNKYEATQELLQKIECEKKEWNGVVAEQVHNLEQKNADLINKLRELESTNHQLAETNQKLSSNTADSSTKYNAIIINLDETKRETDHLKQKMNDLSTIKANLEQEYADAIAALNAKSAEIENLMKTNETIRNEKQQLETEIGVLKISTTELTVHCNDLRTQIEELKKLNGTLEDSIREEKRKLAEIESNMSQEIHETLSQKQEFVKELENTKLLLVTKTSEFVELEQQLAAFKEKNTAQIGELENDLMTSTWKHQELEKSYNEVLTEKSQLATEIEKLRSTSDELQTNKLDLEHKLEELETCKSNLNAELDTEKSKQLEIESKLTHDIEQITEEKSKLELQLFEVSEQLELKCSQYINLEKELATLKMSSSTQIADIETQLNEIVKKYEQLNNDYERVMSEKNEVENDLQDLLHQQKEQSNTITALNAAIIESKIHGETALDALLKTCIKSSQTLTERTIFDSDTTKSIGTITYFMVITEELKDILIKLNIVYEKYLSDDTNVEGLVRRLISSGHLFSIMHLLGIISCNNSNDIDKGDRNIELMKTFCQNVLTLYQLVLDKSDRGQVSKKIDELQNELQEIINRVNELANRSCESDQLSDLIESELNTMDKSIEEAAQFIEEMLKAAKKSDSGLKLEVNEKILDSCTVLIKAIAMLVKKSRSVQAEIVAQGKGSSTAKEFYKRNHQWTEGMISAAKNVAGGAKFLVGAANKAVSGEAKQQLDLIVAAQEIAASTAQLVVASRVKAPRGSQNLNALNEASKKVTQATGGVVAVVKDGNKKLEDQDDFVFATLSVHQAKTLEMEMQVKILELEQSLQLERQKLSALRKKNYAAIE